MPVLNGSQIISQLKEQLHNQSGRHMYVVLGSYPQLEQFEQEHLCQALLPDGRRFPPSVNFNLELLARIEDERLRQMVKNEARTPQTVVSQLNKAFDLLLRDQFSTGSFLILKQCELMFAYDLDLAKLRTFANNQNHLLLLLPGRYLGNQIVVFQGTDPRFEKTFPSQLVTENNLWEIHS